MTEARRLPGDHADALGLVARMERELESEYGPPVPGLSPTATPEDFSPPGGAFVVLYEDGRPLAGGGLKRLTADTAEIKRMYVLPEERSRGLARRLLAELERAARELGYSSVRLDSAAPQRHAIALYRSAGFREIPDYNDNPYATFWAEKEVRGRR